MARNFRKPRRRLQTSTGAPEASEFHVQPSMSLSVSHKDTTNSNPPCPLEVHQVDEPQNTSIPSETRSGSCADTERISDGETPGTSSKTIVETLFSSTANIQIPDLLHLNDGDLMHMTSAKCFNVPTGELLCELIEHYFLNVHPMLPLLDEKDYRGFHTVEKIRAQVPIGREVSLLLLQAIMFVSCEVSAIKEQALIPLLTESLLVC